MPLKAFIPDNDPHDVITEQNILTLQEGSKDKCYSILVVPNWFSS